MTHVIIVLFKYVENPDVRRVTTAIPLENQKNIGTFCLTLPLGGVKKPNVPTAFKLNLVRQVCNHIPEHLIPKIVRETWNPELFSPLMWLKGENPVGLDVKAQASWSTFSSVSGLPIGRLLLRKPTW